MNDETTRSILFVCMGNICRSPTGEGVLQHLVDSRNLGDRIRIDSAGTIGYHTGKPADSRMRAAAKKRGYDLLSRARQVTPTDLEVFQLVIAMDSDNHDDVCSIHQQPLAKIKMLSAFLDGTWPRNVPDPYYGGPDGFEYVLDMIEAACPAILDELLNG